MSTMVGVALEFLEGLEEKLLGLRQLLVAFCSRFDYEKTVIAPFQVKGILGDEKSNPNAVVALKQQVVQQVSSMSATKVLVTLLSTCLMKTEQT